MRRISAMAETYYILIAPHNPNGPIETPVSVHLSAAILNLLIFEHALSLPWHDRVQIDLVVLKDGYFEFPTPPGLGVELDMDVLNSRWYEPRPHAGVFYDDGGVADVRDILMPLTSASLGTFRVDNLAYQSYGA
mgnify:FL=1